MDLATFEWLLTEEGAQLLAAATRAQQAGDPVQAAREIQRAAPTATAERRAAALAQAALRERGKAKFGDTAARLWFTSDGLEQATRPLVAAHRATRLAAAEPASVVDLGCSIGSDLLAMARVGINVTGIDLDPVRVAIARANLSALGLPGVVHQADATAFDLDRYDAAFVDPARRGGRGRSFDPRAWTPPWSFVQSVLQRRSVVKAAPGVPHHLVPDEVEAEWVSEGGEVKEAALWSADLATCRRRATVISAPSAAAGTATSATLTDAEDPWRSRARPVRAVGPYLYEPDGAVIRAGLVTAVADRVGGGLLDEQIAWVTADTWQPTPFARAYRVIERLPYREKQLRMALRERGVGRLTIKKRGVDVVPEELRKRLALRGDREATLVLTRAADQGAAFLVEPL